MNGINIPKSSKFKIFSFQLIIMAKPFIDGELVFLDKARSILELTASGKDERQREVQGIVRRIAFRVQPAAPQLSS